MGLLWACRMRGGPATWELPRGPGTFRRFGHQGYKLPVNLGAAELRKMRSWVGRGPLCSSSGCGWWLAPWGLGREGGSQATAPTPTEQSPRVQPGRSEALTAAPLACSPAAPQAPLPPAAHPPPFTRPPLLCGAFWPLVPGDSGPWICSSRGFLIIPPSAFLEA